MDWLYPIILLLLGLTSHALIIIEDNDEVGGTIHKSLFYMAQSSEDGPIQYISTIKGNNSKIFDEEVEKHSKPSTPSPSQPSDVENNPIISTDSMQEISVESSSQPMRIHVQRVDLLANQDKYFLSIYEISGKLEQQVLDIWANGLLSFEYATPSELLQFPLEYFKNNAKRSQAIEVKELIDTKFGIDEKLQPLKSVLQTTINKIPRSPKIDIIQKDPLQDTKFNSYKEPRRLASKHPKKIKKTSQSPKIKIIQKAPLQNSLLHPLEKAETKDSDALPMKKCPEDVSVDVLSNVIEDLLLIQPNNKSPKFKTETN